MDLRRLTYFLAVVDEGGFTSAAKAVFVSQPALSLAVKELEHELGTELFERLGRSVRLGSPADIASTVAMLMSDDGEWINGQVISVDGGITMR